MTTTSQPRVSVITPAYNGARYLAQSIESVLAQTYQNWDYTIIDNCSTDDTRAIAERFANRDGRIRVLRNDTLLPIIQNHNHAIRQISPESKYCKFVFADDWIYPECLERMVALAEEQPSVGIVGAYTMDGRSVIWPGPEYPANRVPGRDVCRGMLLEGRFVLGTLNSLLLRADLIRKRSTFFNEDNLHADTESYYDVLSESDFGFVHQVLSFSRVRKNSVGALALDLNSVQLGYYVTFLKYGPLLLDSDEYRRRAKIVRREYHEVLAHNLLRARPKQFWNYHQRNLKSFGSRINWWCLPGLAALDLLRRALRPSTALKRAWWWWRRALGLKTSAEAD
jgi:glycosyltransferase involved in cell wall biosynthesis